MFTFPQAAVLTLVVRMTNATKNTNSVTAPMIVRTGPMKK